MKLIENKRFHNAFLGNDDIIENAIFNKCEFENCLLSIPANALPDNRTMIRNCEFKNSTMLFRHQNKGILENVLFENIKMGKELILSGIIFNKVKLKGNFNSMLILSSSGKGVYLPERGSYLNEDELKLFDDYTQNFYKNVEWALDISEAAFNVCEIEADIPVHLIKRNPETQMLLKFEKVKNSNWVSNPKIQDSWAKYFCSAVMKAKKDNIVVAPLRNKKKYIIYMEAINILREEGIAELD